MHIITTCAVLGRRRKVYQASGCPAIQYMGTPAAFGKDTQPLFTHSIGGTFRLMGIEEPGRADLLPR